MCHSLTGVTEVPGKGMGILHNFEKKNQKDTGAEVLQVQNFQKFRVLWRRRTELTKVPSGYKTCCTRTPGIVATGAQNFPELRVYGYECRAELPEVPGTGMNVLQNLQKFFVG